MEYEPGAEVIADMQERFARMMMWPMTPLGEQMASYMKIDKLQFIPAEAIYITSSDLPETRGRLSNSLATIGTAVAVGYGLGVGRGFFGALGNEQGLAGRAWVTRMINSMAKHGTGYAKIGGTATFGCCALKLIVDSMLARYY